MWQAGNTNDLDRLRDLEQESRPVSTEKGGAGKAGVPATVSSTESNKSLRSYGTRPVPVFWVDVAGQRLVHRQGSVPIFVPISTAAAGIDNREGSGGTPPGWHAIEAVIGVGEPLGTIFESRRPIGRTEEFSKATNDDRDLILTRVIWLRGLEPGLNQGPGVDSRDRYIYLHGTNQEHRLGQPASHGCVRLANAHIAALADEIDPAARFWIG